MLPIQIYINILIRNEDRKERMREINRERRLLRNESDPFSMPDNQFAELFRLTKDMVTHILFPVLIPNLERASPLAISPQQKVLIALHFYATGGYQKRIGLDWQAPICQQTTSNILHEVTPLIVNYLNNWIQFPRERHEINRIKARYMEMTRFPGVVGAIDCTHVAILAPSEQEHNYLNRKGYHSKNIQVICNYDLEFLNINARYGGAAHDAFIFRQSAISNELERRYNEGDRSSWLLGDSGYPQKPYLMTPIVDAQPGTPAYSYTRRHIAARNSVERSIGVWKARFRCISGENKLRYKSEIAGEIANACAILHNICIRGRLDLPQNLPQEPLENHENFREIGRDNRGFEARRQLIERYFQ